MWHLKNSASAWKLLIGSSNSVDVNMFLFLLQVTWSKVQPLHRRVSFLPASCTFPIFITLRLCQQPPSPHPLVSRHSLGPFRLSPSLRNLSSCCLQLLVVKPMPQVLSFHYQYFLISNTKICSNYLLLQNKLLPNLMA